MGSKRDDQRVAAEPIKVSAGEVSAGEPIKVSAGEQIKVSAGEPIKVSAGEPIKVSAGEPIKVSAGEPIKVSAGEPESQHRGTQNLIPMSMRTKEEVKAIASKGGKNSVEKRRKNKTFKEALQWYLDLEVHPTNKTEEELLARYPGLTNRDYVAISAVGAATQDKDVRAMVFARDTTGELPKQTIGIEQEKPFEIKIQTIE